MMFSIFSCQIRSREIAISELNGLAPSRVSSLFFLLLCCKLLYIESFFYLGNYSFMIEFVDFSCKLTEILKCFVWFWMLTMLTKVFFFSCRMFIRKLEECFFRKSIKTAVQSEKVSVLHNLFEISWLVKMLIQVIFFIMMTTSSRSVEAVMVLQIWWNLLKFYYNFLLPFPLIFLFLFWSLKQLETAKAQLQKMDLK